VIARRWIGAALATCGGLAVSGLALGQQEAKPAPQGYTKPGPVTGLARAPSNKRDEETTLSLFDLKG